MDGRANPLMDRKVVGVSGYLSIYLSTCKLESEAILGESLRFWFWQSKTKQSCETVPCAAPATRHASLRRVWCAFSIFWHRKLLRVTMACAFFNSSASRGWGVFGILTSKSASRHNGVQFFVSHLTRWLCTRRFTSLLFDTPGPQIIEKTWWLATFLPFSDSFFSLTFFLLLFSCLTLPTSAFHLSILSEVWLLNFLRKYN